MFTVDKTTLPRYWCVMGDRVEERIGTPHNEYEFENKYAAHTFAYNRKSERLRREYFTLANRFSRAVLAIYKLRSLWNSRIANGLRAWQNKVSQARLAYIAGPTIQWVPLPNQIPVQGDRLAIGTRVYEFDSYSLQLRVATVEAEHIYYYSHNATGSAATYTLSNGRSVKSTLESGFTNIEHYLDSKVANARMRTAVQQRIEELQKQIE